MRILTPAIILTLSLAAASCSNSKSNESSVEVASIDVSSFIGDNAVESAPLIDSLAMEADFLKPDQGVSVLVGLSRIVAAEQQKGSAGKRLEYMRKFIDTYDILASRGDEFKQAIGSAAQSTGVDLNALFNQYRDTLSEEADGSAIEGETDSGTTAPAAPAPKADSTKTETPSPAPGPAPVSAETPSAD